MYLLLHLIKDERIKLKILAVASATLIVIGIGCTFSAWQDYHTLGNSPTSITIEEAVPSADTTPNYSRWVSLSGLTSIWCSQVLEENYNGTKLKESFFAADSKRERFVYVTARMRDGGCAALPSPTSGILKKADSGLPEWLAKKGLRVPASKYPLMELEAGGDASSAKLDLYIGLGLLLVAIAGLVAALHKLRSDDAPSAGARFYQPDATPAGQPR